MSIATSKIHFSCLFLICSTQFAQSLSDGLLSSPMEGPHALARRNNGQHNDTNPQLDSLSVGMWIIRLHLAQYCITGKYPTWFHRFARLATENALDKNNTSTKSVIPCQPSTHRSVGLLIFTQAAVSLLQNASRYICRNIVELIDMQNDSLATAATTPGHKQLHISTLFPSYSSSRKITSSSLASGRNDVDDGTTSVSTTTTCTICRMDRNYPAAPSTCGHVCCWRCLTQWVSTVRPECPLCRSPCKPQDIIALYDYDLPPS